MMKKGGTQTKETVKHAGGKKMPQRMNWEENETEQLVDEKQWEKKRDANDNKRHSRNNGNDEP